MSNVNAVTFTIVVVLFLVVTLTGFAAARWRRAEDMLHLNEWGLGGRGFGTFIAWFLLGGDLYTAYTFIAVPAAMFGAGAVTGYFAVAYTIIVFPIALIFLPRLWSIARVHHYVTPADFIRGRYGSRGLSLALMVYPHAVTGVLSTKRRDIIKRNMALLPIYSIMLGFIALLGYVALADKVTAANVKKANNAQLAVPYLFQHLFPSWFTGIAFSAIVIGALVPAAIMAIAAANLFTRNIFKEFFKPDASPRLQTRVSQWVSLIVKVGALLFAITLPKTFSINLQLLGGIWILQTFPSIVFGLFTRWFHRYALLAGWLAGMIFGTVAAYNVSTPTTSHWAGSVDTVFGHTVYIGLTAIVLNVAVTVILTLVLRVARVPAGTDETARPQYTADPVDTPAPAPAAAVLGSEVSGGDLPSRLAFAACLRGLPSRLAFAACLRGLPSRLAFAACLSGAGSPFSAVASRLLDGRHGVIEGEERAGQDVDGLQPHEVVPAPAQLRLGGQPVRVPEPGPLQFVADAAGVGESRLPHAQGQVFAEYQLRVGGKVIRRAVEHGPADGHQLLQRVRGEVEVMRDPRAHAGVALEEHVHAVLVACQDHYQLVAVVLHHLEQDVDTLLAVVF